MTPDPDRTRAASVPAPDASSDADRTRQRASSDTAGDSAPDPSTRPDDPTRPRAGGSAEATPPPGFVLERELGAGGMGVVYLARQSGLNRPVALKLVRGERVDGKALIRFLAEAEAVAAVRHPNVVEVFQYGEHDGKPYMALEYCPGGDLTSLSKVERARDAAWFRRVAELMAQVADGVNAAHAQGIVHRDLKPHNVFLAADGTPKVADFGLAKRGIGGDLTNTGAVMGTPAYMAPEQAKGETKFVGPEADVWALGVMLFELCSGERPIDTRGPMMDGLAKVAKGEVSQLRSVALTVPGDLALIVHKCLSTDPRDRYATAGGLAADLRNWLDGRPISARPVGAVERAVKWARRNKRLAGMGLAVMLTMAVATGVSLGFGLEAKKQTEMLEQKANDLETQLTETRRVLDLAWLRDADVAFDKRQIELARDRLAVISPENRCIAWWLVKHRIEGGDLTLWGHTSPVNSVAFSVDGRRIVTGSDDTTARVWDATTGQSLLELKGHTDLVTSVAFSPDGRRVVTESDDNLKLVWDGTTGQSLDDLRGQTNWVRKGFVAYSPDGKRVVTGSQHQTARVWDAATTEILLQLAGHTDTVWGGAFSPDGRRVVTGSRDQTARVWDAATGQSLLELKGHTGGVTGVAVSPDGKRVVTGSEDKTARVWGAATEQGVLELTGHTGTVTRLAVSPDGTRIVTASDDKTARVWDAATGQYLLTLTGQTDSVVSVAYSEDGTRVVVDTGRGVRIFNATTGQLLMGEPRPQQLKSGNVMPDGRILVPDGTRVVIVDPTVKVNEVELAWRKWIAQPDPQRHAKLAEEFIADPFASAVQKSLEQKARGQLAVEAGDFQQAFRHYLAAELLRPKPIPVETPPPSPKLRAEWAYTLLTRGEFAEAVTLTDVLTASKEPWGAVQLYNFACIYAVAGARVERKPPEYADRALELLNKAVKAGWREHAHMKKDPDLDSLRNRDDFKKLLADLEAKFPITPAPAPNPPKQ